MRKIILLVAILFGAICVYAQSETPPTIIQLGESAASVKAKLKDGFTLPSGWTINVGDTVKLGKGTMPNRAYTFIYESPTASQNIYNDNKKNLNTYTAKYAIVKDLFPYGTKKHGFTIMAKVGVGSMVNYWIELENAAESGEIVKE